MNLYKVTLAYEVMVLAEDRTAAVDLAKRNVGDMSDFVSSKDVELISHLNQVPAEWRRSLPYKDYQ